MAANYLAIKDADFSQVAVEKLSIITMLYNVPDEQMENGANSSWAISAMGYGIVDQSPLQGKVIAGMKFFVTRAGTLHLYKASSPNAPGADGAALTLVGMIEYTGEVDKIVMIDFPTPIALGESEYLILGDPLNSDTIGGRYSSKTQTVAVEQAFYSDAGTSSPQSDGLVPGNTQSLDVDFYTKE